MARQGLMDDAGYDFFDVSDCSNYESCREDAYNDGYADAIDKYKVKCQQKFKELQFETGRAWFDFDAGIDRCLEILDKVEEQLKEQK